MPSSSAHSSQTWLFRSASLLDFSSGILVGISDGAGLNTVPLDTDVKLHLGYVVKKGAQLSETAQKYVAKLESNLKKYARF